MTLDLILACLVMFAIGLIVGWAICGEDLRR